MKHILNNLTETEKNNIREQHSGGMKVMTENFSKLINSKLGDVKPLVNEQSTDPKKELSDLGLKLRNKYKNKICGSNNVSLPFDEEVKRYQILSNKVAYLSDNKLKEDGIIGPEMKKEFCQSFS